MLLVFHVSHAILSVPCSLATTCWEMADLFAVLRVMFLVTFPYGFLGQVWYMYLIVSIPDHCLLPYFDQTAHLHRLISDCAGHMYHIVGKLKLQLNEKQRH